MENTSSFRLILLLILCFSCILGFNGAIPFIRSGNPMKKSRSYGSVADEVYMENKGERWELNTKKIRLMEIEVNDYPGSGANNRHTPRSQLGRGCLDC